MRLSDTNRIGFRCERSENYILRVIETTWVPCTGREDL